MSWCHRFLSVIIVVVWLGGAAWAQDNIEPKQLNNRSGGPETAVNEKIEQPVEKLSKDAYMDPKSSRQQQILPGQKGATAGTAIKNKKKRLAGDNPEPDSGGLSMGSEKHAIPILKKPDANLGPRSLIDKTKAMMAGGREGSKNKPEEDEDNSKTRTGLDSRSFIERTNALMTDEWEEPKKKPTEGEDNPKTRGGSKRSYSPHGDSSY